jgi:ubiquinone/menaquinone biosynthesis C-methylase UbiE
VKPGNKSRFSRVDESEHPEKYVHFLDAAGAIEMVQHIRRRSFERLEVRPGSAILEVGCGTGESVQQMAQIVGAEGQAIGIDNSQTMILAARERAMGLNLGAEFVLADAHHLSFPEAIFDGCRSERTFIHLQDPRKGLHEMIRVARSGAKIVIFEPDFGTLAADLPDPALTRKILNFWCDSFANGWMGRRLPALFKACGLREIVVEPFTMLLNYAFAQRLFITSAARRTQQAGLISQAEAEAWLNQLHIQQTEGYFFCAITAFLVTGCKP